MTCRGNTPGGGTTGAGVHLRGFAFALDWLAIAVWMGALALAGWAFRDVLGPAFTDGPPWGRQLLAFTLVTLPVTLWFASWEAGTSGATPGKRWVGISVRSRDGGPLPPARSLLRNSLKFLPWEISHAALWRVPGWPLDVTGVPRVSVLLLAASWILVAGWVVGALLGPKGEAPYDRLVSARVTRVRGSDNG